MSSRLRDFAQHTDKFYAHQYIEVYEALFEPIRNRVKNVLEVGIKDGASHRMWRDYFDKANIYGIDVHDFCNGMIGEDRISVQFCDAYTDDAVAGFGDLRFDVLVDDGPHSLESFKFFVEKYSSLIADGGILVIEDVTYAEWIPEIAASVPDDLKMNSYCIDRRWVPNGSVIHDELMFIIDKRFI
ncbi:MAG: Paramecium bursaria Chlorella virus 1 [Pseudomonadota bacterium]